MENAYEFHPNRPHVRALPQPVRGALVLEAQQARDLLQRLPGVWGSRELRIIGMTCDRCAKSIEEALAGMRGVMEVQVSYDEGTARIKTEAWIDSAKLIDAVQGKGFGAEVLDRKGSTATKEVSDRSRTSVVDTPTPFRRTAMGIARRSPHPDRRERGGGICLRHPRCRRRR